MSEDDAKKGEKRFVGEKIRRKNNETTSSDVVSLV